MNFNIFDLIFGNPYNKQADLKYNNAMQALKLARLQKNKIAELKALDDMKTSSKALQTTANKAIGKIKKIDSGVSFGFSTMKKSALVAGGLLALVVLVKVIKK